MASNDISELNKTLKNMNTNINSVRKNLYDIARQLRIMNARNEKPKFTGYCQPNIMADTNDTSQNCDIDALYDVIDGGSVNEEANVDGGDSDAQ